MTMVVFSLKKIHNNTLSWFFDNGNFHSRVNDGCLHFIGRVLLSMQAASCGTTRVCRRSDARYVQHSLVLLSHLMKQKGKTVTLKTNVKKKK